MAAKKKSKSRKLVESAMREVHTNEPSTVARAKVSEARKKKMRKAIALTFLTFCVTAARSDSHFAHATFTSSSLVNAN